MINLYLILELFMMLQKIYMSQNGTYYRLLLFFDTLGLTSPIVLQHKLLYEEVCRKKIDWGKLINDTNNNASSKYCFML